MRQSSPADRDRAQRRVRSITVASAAGAGVLTLVGAAVTASLFTLGKFALGIYLGSAGVSSAYGAAGSIVALVIWVYYSAQVLLIGAEFTELYACRYGSRITPDDKAVAVKKSGAEAASSVSDAA